MKILKSIFGNSSKSEHLSAKTFAPASSSVVESSHENDPPIDLFIDNDPPQGEQQKIASNSKSKISIFLERNYHPIGVNDGYEYHSFETLETAKKKIRAEFQLIISHKGQLLKKVQLPVEITKTTYIELDF